MTNDEFDISISIVSHNHINMIVDLINDIKRLCDIKFEIILTLNVHEELPDFFANPTIDLTILQNEQPLGFAENHNNAFKASHGDYFCVLNPDIRFEDNPFPVMIKCLEANSLGVVAPLIKNSDGAIEETVRRFPGPFTIFLKAIYHLCGIDYSSSRPAENESYWVAGMFMLFSSKVFLGLGGFDQRYFLYYEDVEICARLIVKGYRVKVCEEATAIHDARRDSHHKMIFFKWHLASMSRFFLSKTRLLLLLQKNHRHV